MYNSTFNFSALIPAQQACGATACGARSAARGARCVARGGGRRRKREERSAGPGHTVFHFPLACAARRAARGGGCAAHGLVTGWMGGAAGTGCRERGCFFVTFSVLFVAQQALGAAACDSRRVARGARRVARRAEAGGAGQGTGEEETDDPCLPSSPFPCRPRRRKEGDGEGRDGDGGAEGGDGDGDGHGGMKRKGRAKGKGRLRFL